MPWSFEPAALQLHREQTVPFKVASPLMRFASSIVMQYGGNALQPSIDTSDEFREDTVLLHTPSGPVKYSCKVYGHDDSGKIGIEIPTTAREIPEDVVIEALGVEPATLHHRRYSDRGSDNYIQTLWSTLRFPNADDRSGHHWVQQKDRKNFDVSRPAVTTQTVVGGKLGRLVVPQNRSIELGDARSDDFAEESPRQITANTVRGYEDRFKRLALAVGSFLGGVTHLSSRTFEQSPLSLSFHDYGHTKPAARVAATLAVKGYDVSIYDRVPNQGDDVRTSVDPGLRVVVGTKATSSGQETLVAHHGISTSTFSRGQTQWQLDRGISLENEPKVDDIDRVKAPLAYARAN